MKQCNNCGAEMPNNLNFCTNCGTKLANNASSSADNTPHNTNQKAEDTHVSPEPPVTPETRQKPEPAKKLKQPLNVGKIVKRVLLILVALLVVLYLVAQHFMNATTYMSLNSKGEIFTKGGGQVTVNIDYDGYYWEVAYKPDWVVVSEGDNEFYIICQANDTGRDRKDHITIKSGKVLLQLPIGQYGSAQFMKLSKSSVKSKKQGTSLYIKMETDGIDPQIKCPDFCSIEELTERGFTLVVDENTDYTRSGTVYVSEDNVKASIFVSQEGKCTNCNGKGFISCTYCNGVGVHYGYGYGYGYGSSDCYYCTNGTNKCYACGGDGIK